MTNITRLAVGCACAAVIVGALAAWCRAANYTPPATGPGSDTFRLMDSPAQPQPAQYPPVPYAPAQSPTLQSNPMQSPPVLSPPSAGSSAMQSVPQEYSLPGGSPSYPTSSLPAYASNPYPSPSANFAANAAVGSTPPGGVMLAGYGPVSPEPIAPPPASYPSAGYSPGNYSSGGYAPGGYYPAMAPAPAYGQVMVPVSPTGPMGSSYSSFESPTTHVSPPPPTVCDRLTESSWYTKIEYFHWNERIDGANFETENGPLYTLGYMHRYGDERVRLEVFDTTVDSSSDIVDNLGVEPLRSHTNYFGVRGEYDWLFNPEALPHLTFFTGVGTRFWVRDLPDDFTPGGVFVQGYQETWWTFYPYIGLETRRTLGSGSELYGMGRIGFTAITLERATINDLALYPRIGPTAQLEAGWRNQNIFVAGFSELMSWSQSAVVSGWLQPASTMVTVGVRAGATF